MPPVSVIVPTYNTLAYLPVAIESILNQTFADFEIILVNDGSTDGTEEWVKTLTDPRIRYVYQDNQGLSAARNTGIQLASGQYIALLDADDAWEPTKLAQQVAYLNTNPEVGMVHTWVSFMDGEGLSTGRIWKTSATGWALPQLLHRNDVAVLSVLVRRDCFEKIGDFDTSLRSLEDWEMWLRLAVLYPIGIIQEPLAKYRQLPGSMSRNCEVMEASFKQVIEKHFALAPEKLQFIRVRSYGAAYQCLAWKAIQVSCPDLALARSYYQLALRHDPKILLTLDGLKLWISIQTQRLLTPSGYDRLLMKFYAIRRLMPAR
jgi:glycosyltransferase involved in cell wall biosynthesis